MLIFFIVSSFLRRLLLVFIVLVLQDQPLAQILSSLALQMTHFSIMLSDDFFGERHTEMIDETLILLTIYAMMPCASQFLSNTEARDHIGYFMIAIVAFSLLLTLSQIVRMVVSDLRRLCVSGKFDFQKNSIAEKRLA